MSGGGPRCGPWWTKGANVDQEVVLKSPRPSVASERKLVLGLYDGTHDAGAALGCAGELLAAVSEERLSRRKGQGGWPGRSLRACLETAGVAGRELDGVVFAGWVNPNPVLRASRGLQVRWELDQPGGWDPKGLRDMALEAMHLKSPFPYLESGSPWVKAMGGPLVRALSRRVREDIPDFRGEVAIVDHHRCHAAGAWFTSGVERALVLVADGVGDGLALSVWEGTGSELKRLDAWSFPHSHGLLYATITAMLGFRPFRHEGKVAGLAAVGDAGAVPVAWPFSGPVEARRLNSGLGPGLRKVIGGLRECRREDVCAWLQAGLEGDLVALVGHWIRKTGARAVALSGGVFANVRLNQRIGELAGLEHLWVFPHMGDGGLAAGAALDGCHVESPQPMRHAFLGPGLDPTEVAAVVRTAGTRARRVEGLGERIGMALAAGGLVGICRGRSEYGPRALGNRSILAPVVDVEVVPRLNRGLSRSGFMPFAPILLESALGDAVGKLGPAKAAAGFMTVTAEARAGFRSAAPAVVHVDGSLRLQIVADADPILGQALITLGRQGLPKAALNTSFNLHEEPIVQTAGEAWRAAGAARLDHLVLEDWWIDNPGPR